MATGDQKSINIGGVDFHREEKSCLFSLGEIGVSINRIKRHARPWRSNHLVTKLGPHQSTLKEALKPHFWELLDMDMAPGK